jgi:hypothetical protein
VGVQEVEEAQVVVVVEYLPWVGGKMRPEYWG